MFLCVTGSLEAIGAEINRPRQSVADWRSGRKTPSPDARARIEQAFNVPARAWALLPGAPLALSNSAPGSGMQLAAPPPAELEPIATASVPSTLDECLEILAVIRRDRMRHEIMPSERAKLIDAEARVLTLRARLEQAAELSEARYVLDHPAWKRLQRVILQALESHPVASRAVVEAITAAYSEVKL